MSHAFPPGESKSNHHDDKNKRCSLHHCMYHSLTIHLQFAGGLQYTEGSFLEQLCISCKQLPAVAEIDAARATREKPKNASRTIKQKTKKINTGH